MEEALRFFRAYEVWIYLLLGLGGLIYARKFLLAWQELRGAAFGLERENAQSRLNQAAGMLVLVLAMAVTEFVLVSFVAPGIPGASPISTPTLDLLATPTTTLPASPNAAGTALITETVSPGMEETQQALQGCDPGRINITSPGNEDQIGGAVEIQGTADIDNFGFYKLEMKRPEETSWLTILAGNQVTQDGTLGTWNTGLLSPGVYDLSLVVVDNEGQPSPRCTVQVRITSPQGTESP
jgi:hypothetical protein